MPKPIPVRCDRCGHGFKTRKPIEEARCGACSSRKVTEISAEDYKELRQMEKELDAEPFLDTSDPGLAGGVGDLSWDSDLAEPPAPATSNPNPAPSPRPAPTNPPSPLDSPELKEVMGTIGKVAKSMNFLDKRLGMIETKLGAGNGQGQDQAPVAEGLPDGMNMGQAINSMMGIMMMKALSQSLAPPPPVAPQGDGATNAALQRQLDQLTMELRSAKNVTPDATQILSQQIESIRQERMQKGFEEMANAIRQSRAPQSDPTEQLFRGIQLAKELSAPGDQYGYMAKTMDTTERVLEKVIDKVSLRMDDAMELQAMKQGTPPPFGVQNRGAERQAQARVDHPEYFDESIEGVREAAREIGLDVVPLQPQPSEIVPGRTTEVVDVAQYGLDRMEDALRAPGSGELQEGDLEDLYGEE